MADRRFRAADLFLSTELRQAGICTSHLEHILDQPELRATLFQRQTGEDRAGMVFLRQIHQRVGFVRMPGCTTQVVTVPALGHILTGDGRGTVQHRGPEQASPQHFVLVNVDLQRFHSLSFLVSNNRYHNSRRKSTKTFTSSPAQSPVREGKACSGGAPDRTPSAGRRPLPWSPRPDGKNPYTRRWYQ